MNNDSFSLKPILAALIGAAALVGVSAQAAPAITIDEHGKVMVQGHAVSEVLPATGDHPLDGGAGSLNKGTCNANCNC